ncbi:MFS transporter [Pelobacter propionicus]|uniref:Major facilitator superfamily MFS_1 n=1 Tax=Pelobacter propionicus (strain DSM 2379 / NBRC 103807 / OttBd1) TaxID=338966 RepID=A1AP56_PELPD|nr:MFS transporter [Pelobacter propionicus]ABK99126.1 major facilitator superfamily MFS_1 [Pelobacter propionicus DSM 2379]
MPKPAGLFTPAFLVINFQFALVTGIAALFFAFSGYLAHLGISPATAGFIISADALAALIIQPLIAPLVHPGSARRWLCGGSLVLATALFMIGQSDSVPLLVTARLLQGAGFICVLTALITMVVQLIPPEMSGRAFGWVSLIRLVPYAIIPPLLDFTRLPPSSFGTVLNLAGGAALIPLLGLLLPRSGQETTAGGAPSPGLSGMRDSLSSPAISLLLVSALLFFCGYSAIFFYLKQFGSSLGIAKPSLFFSIATLAMILVRVAGGWLFDRYSKLLFCGAGLLAVAVCYALLPLSPSGRMFFTLAGLCGLGWGISMPLQAAVMFDISAPRARGLNQNLLIVMMQGGFFLGPFLGGQIISCSGFGPLFASLALLTLASLLTMLVAGHYAKRHGAEGSGQAVS